MNLPRIETEEFVVCKEWDSYKSDYVWKIRLNEQIHSLEQWKTLIQKAEKIIQLFDAEEKKKK